MGSAEVKLCAGLLLLAACHDQLALQPPTADPATRSMVLVAMDGEEPQWIEAFDLDEGRGYPPLVWRGDPSLIALEYGCSIERLGLTYGRQTLAARPLNEPLLPAPRRLSATPTEAAEWEPAELSAPIDAALRRLPLLPGNACRADRAKFRAVQVPVPLDDLHRDPAFAIAYDEDSSLIGSSDGHVYRVFRDGTLELEPQLEDRTYLGAYRSPSGELWMLSDRGTLARGSLEGVAKVSTTDLLHRPRRIALVGPTDADAPFELFASTSTTNDNAQRVFVRFDGESWEKIASGPVHNSIFLPAVAWIGPGHAVAIGTGPEPNSVVRYENGSVSQESLPSAEGPSAILEHPTLGTLVGNDDGSIAQHTGGGWEPLAGGYSSRWVRTMAAVGDGFILGSSTQVNFISYGFGQYQPASGFCERQTFTPEMAAASHLARLGVGSDTLVAATLTNFDDPLNITILELEEPPHTCSRD